MERIRENGKMGYWDLKGEGICSTTFISTNDHYHRPSIIDHNVIKVLG